METSEQHQGSRQRVGESQETVPGMIPGISMEVLVSRMEREVHCRKPSEQDTCLSSLSSVLTQEPEEKEGER